MQNKLRTFLANERKSFILLIVALLAPESVGFQHLEWWSWWWIGSSHSIFIVSLYTWQIVLSIRWDLTCSDWFSGLRWGLDGWLLWPNPFIRPSDQLLLVLMPQVPRLVFVVVVALYRQGRADKSILIIAGILLLGFSSAICASLTAANAIYGIPPGIELLFRAPDVDTKLFLPIPILLITGLLLSKRPNLSDVKVWMAGLDRT